MFSGAFKRAIDSFETSVRQWRYIGFALAVKLAAVMLVFPGWLTLWLAIAAGMGASLLVTLNGMRLLTVKPERV